MNRPQRLQVVPFVSLLAFVLTLAACSGAPNTGRIDGLATLSGPWVKDPGPGWQEMLSGDVASARRVFTEIEASNPRAEDLLWARFGRAEAAYLEGRYTESLEAHLSVVEAGAPSDLALWSLMRISDLADLAPDYEGAAARVWKMQPEGASPQFRMLRSRVALEGARREWIHSQATDPFDGTPFGVPPAWRMVGPTSITAALDFDEATEPEGDESLADSYELLGYRRRTRLETSTSNLVKPIIPLSGIYVAETWLTLDRDAVVDIAGDFQGLARVTLNGEAVLTRDDRQEYGPSKVVTRGVELSVGVYRVAVRMGLARDYKETFGLTFLPRTAAGLKFSATRPDGKHGDVDEAGTVGSWIGEAPIFADWDNPVATYLAAWMSATFLDEAAGREALDRLEELAPKFGGLHLARAQLFSRLWSIPGNIRDREVVASLRAATVADPGLYRAHLWLAARLREQGRKDATKEAINKLVEARPDEPATWREAAKYYGWRGFEPQAEKALRTAQRLDPKSCKVAQELYALLQERDQVLDLAELSEETQHCDLLRWQVAKDVAAMAGSPGEVLSLVARDVERYPDRTWTYKAHAEALAHYVGPREAIEVLDNGLQRIPNDPTLVVLKADLHHSLGEHQQAMDTLSAGLEEHPGLASFHDRLALLRGTLPMDDLAADGIAAIRDYESAPASFPSAAIYVLDYMARRYFADGSSADVTHLVIKVLAKEGIDEFAEVRFPRGAVKLLARTVKRNGQVIEPRPTAGKPTISMPSLAVGDYIEYAYLTFNSRLATEREAAVGADFYFKMANIASAHSEFVVEVPASWKPEFVPRNSPPTAVVTPVGDLVRYRFLRTGSAQPRPEPHSVGTAEYLPHVQMIHRYGWPDAHKMIQNRLAGGRATSPLLVQRARTLTAGAESDEAKIRAIFAFVSKHVRERSYGDFSTPAAHVEQSGQGNPLTLMQALLEVVGIDSKLYRIKTLSQDPVETAIPAINSYGFTALRVELEDEELWLNPAGPNAIFNYLPKSAQAAPAISVEPGASLEREWTPSFSENNERRDVVFSLVLDAQGNLSGETVETLRGGRAIARRNSYDDMASDESIRKYVERTVNYDFSGGELVSYEISGREDPAAELVLKYTFRRPGYARQTAEGLVIEDRYDLPDITRRYARLAKRTAPMMLNNRLDESVHIHFDLPQASTVSGPGGDDIVAFESAFGNYERSVSAVPGQLDITHRLIVPVQRVATDEYQEFVDWAGDVDRATYGRIVVK